MARLVRRRRGSIRGTSSQMMSSWASASTLESTVSIEAAPNADQRLGVAQRRVEAAIAHVDQRAVFRDRQHVQLRLGEEAERALARRTGSALRSKRPCASRICARS